MITIYGASDDLVEVAGCKGADEFNVDGTGSGPLMWRGDLVAPDGGQMRLYGLYDGCWHFSVGQVDEDFPLPSWPCTLAQHERGYSVEVSIDAPEHTRLTNVWTGKHPL